MSEYGFTKKDWALFREKMVSLQSTAKVLQTH